TAIEEVAWDGQWYRRAYFDDGTPLGSVENDECQIDSLSQSWSVISGGGNSKRSRQALEHAYERLVNTSAGIVSLLAPPFSEGSLKPGYIKGYLPGTRENGGQYTHAAAWFIMAMAMLGEGNKAFDLFRMINPINHAADLDGVEKYQGEPYVTCGDVYSVAPHLGRAGWSWYTGSAAWLYKVGLEHILGLQVNGSLVSIDPCVPALWDHFELDYRLENVLFKFVVQNPDGVEHGVRRVVVDGKPWKMKHVPVPAVPPGEERVVHIEIEMGSR
ncbi:hypothetical protein OAO01_08655, partial [Oligoflexia bacterium]|nr:hypothetical protein [Oligoflexia bacterium]